MEIGRKLKMERKKAGKSQQQIADHLLVTRQAISNWENEKSRPYNDINKNIIPNEKKNRNGIFIFAGSIATSVIIMLRSKINGVIFL